MVDFATIILYFLLGSGWIVAFAGFIHKLREIVALNNEMREYLNEIKQSIESLNDFLHELKDKLEDVIHDLHSEYKTFSAAVEQLNNSATLLDSAIKQLEKTSNNINGCIGGLLAQLKDMRKYLLEIRRAVRVLKDKEVDSNG